MKQRLILSLVVVLALPLASRAQNAAVVPDSQATTLHAPTLRDGAYRLTRDVLRVLPSRDVSDYFSVFPGVTALNSEVHVRGGRPVETDYRIEGFSVRRIVGAGDVGLVIPEALDVLELHVGGYGAAMGNATAGLVQQRLRTGGSRLEVSAQLDTDAATGWLDPGYSYDAYDVVATLGGPLLTQRLRFFGALDYRKTDNYWRTYWDAVELGAPAARDGEATAPAPIAWEDGELPGAGRPQERVRVNVTADLDFAPLHLRAVYVQRDETRRINPTPVFTMFDAARVPERDEHTRLASLQGSYQLTNSIHANVGASYYADVWEVYDPLFGPPEADGSGGALLDLMQYYDRDAVRAALGGDTELADLYASHWSGAYGSPGNYSFNGFHFYRPGAVLTGYERSDQRAWQVDASAEAEAGRHSLVVGGAHRQWRVRSYAADARTLAYAAREDVSFVDAVQAESEVAAYQLAWGGYGGIGYDAFMNEVNDGPDGARTPSISSLFVEDRFPLGPMRLTAGLRYERFDMGLLTPDDPAAPEYDLATISIDGLSETEASYVLQPRLAVEASRGMTSVRVQAGRYAQMPDMAYAYRSRGYIGGVVMMGHNFVNGAFAWNLEPVVTDQVEVGLTQRWSRWFTLDLAAFLRLTRNQLRIARQEVDPTASVAADYNLYVSDGESRIAGASVGVETVRWRHWRALVNYTFMDARGRDSRPNEQVRAIENGLPLREELRPLAYSYRHWATALVDYQTGATRNPWTEHWTGGLLMTLHSGHPYTRGRGSLGGSKTAGDGMLLSETDPRANQFFEPVGASTTPWVFNLDVRLEKGFAVGPTTSTLFLYVQNVLNTRHVHHVYGMSGEPDDDGFLGDANPIGDPVEIFGAEYVRFYEALNNENRQHFVRDRGYDLYGTPRTVRLGVRVAL